MSHNIDHICIVRNDGFSITRVAAQKLLDEGEYLDNYPEGNFMEQVLEREAPRWGITKTTDEDGSERLHWGDTLWWYGEGSGSTYDELLAALESTDGDADLVLIWEGGNDITGLRVCGGSIVEHEVVMTLGEEVGDD